MQISKREHKERLSHKYEIHRKNQVLEPVAVNSHPYNLFFVIWSATSRTTPFYLIFLCHVYYVMPAPNTNLY